MPPTGRVVVVPGRAFGPAVPQLFFPAWAATRRGREVEWVVWPDVETAAELGEWETSRWVDERVHLEGAALVIGKSLGSHAALSASRLAVPAVWVTPLILDEPVRAALAAATAPMLLVGGTADPSWHGEVAHALTPHVLEIPDADHGLFVPGPLDRSAANMGLLATAVERFLDEVVWPVG